MGSQRDTGSIGERDKKTKREKRAGDGEEKGKKKKSSMNVYAFDEQ